MTSEPVPRIGSGIYMTQGFIYSLNSLFKEFVCSDGCRGRYKAGGGDELAARCDDDAARRLAVLMLVSKMQMLKMQMVAPSLASV